MQTLS
jgi:hypothetical protein